MERVERELKCPKCLHEWTSRTLEPKECPHCKKRLDWSKHTYCVDPRESFVIPMSGDKGEFLDSFDHPVKVHCSDE